VVDKFAGRLLLVGNLGGTNIGASLWTAAGGLGIDSQFCDAHQAAAAPRWLRSAFWHLGGHRPVHLRRFSRTVLAACHAFRPTWLLATGIAPLEAACLRAARQLGIRVLNYLTDDPWNPSHKARWFLRGLPYYDVVFTPRRANLQDLRHLGCPRVEYLPFGYDPDLCFPEPLPTEAERQSLASDVLFVGGADADRIPYLAALLAAELRVAAYGDYWARYPQTRRCDRGYASPELLRRVTASAHLALCLVRRSNRDGHVMRTFEIAAMRGCMLAEDTAEHHELLGADGQAVVYFTSPSQLVAKARWLLDHPQERQRLAEALYQRVTQGGHTYGDRLVAMLAEAGEGL
jgi:glycosyltransferase involved in cell wall biosynthesis